MYDVTDTTALNAKFDVLQQQITANGLQMQTLMNAALLHLTTKSAVTQLQHAPMIPTAFVPPCSYPTYIPLCTTCGGSHDASQCPSFISMEQVDYLGYYQGSRNVAPQFHPNMAFDKYQPAPLEFQNQRANGFQGGNYENAPEFRMDKLADKVAKLMEKLDYRLDTQEARLQNTESSLRALEKQVGQIAETLQQHPPRSLASNMEKNQKENCRTVLSEEEINQPIVRPYQQKIPFPTALTRGIPKDPFGEYMAKISAMKKAAKRNAIDEQKEIHEEEQVKEVVEKVETDEVYVEDEQLSEQQEIATKLPVKACEPAIPYPTSRTKDMVGGKFCTLQVIKKNDMAVKGSKEHDKERRSFEGPPCLELK